MAQSNSRFNALDTLVVTVHSGKIPIGLGRGIMTRGRPLSLIAPVKSSIMEIKAENNCLVYALIVAIARVENDVNYTAYRNGRKIRPVVQTLLQETGIDLTSVPGIPEHIRFQEHFWDYKITVYQGLSCDDIMFEGQVDTSKRINLLYDDVERHYHVITNVTGDLTKNHVSKACSKSCRSEITHDCDQTYIVSMASPPCAFSGVRFPCDECNRHFRSRACFANHKRNTSKRKSVYERKHYCATCGALVTQERYECN